MAPTPDDASHLGDGIRRRYEDAELGLIGRVARAVGRGAGKLGGALGKLGRLKRSGKKLLDDLGKSVQKELPPLVVEAYEIGADEAAAEVERMRAGENPPEPSRRTRDHSDLPGAANPRELADRLVREFHPQILRSTDDVYRRIVAEVYAPALAEGRPRLETSQRALARFADEGIRGFTDKAGRNWRIESYVEMAMRAAFARATIAGALDRYRADGIDLLYVPDVPFGCPDCTPYENKILAMRPGAKAPKGVTIKATIAEAVARGFLHPNCRHNIVPWVPGIHITDAQPDPEGYKATQQQRALERRIRAAKRAQVAMQESGADAATQRRARDEVRSRQAHLRQFLAANPQLMRYSSREQVRKAGETVERAV